MKLSNVECADCGGRPSNAIELKEKFSGRKENGKIIFLCNHCRDMRDHQLQKENDVKVSQVLSDEPSQNAQTSNSITEQTRKISNKFVQVYQWASKLTTETRTSLTCYYWTEPAKRALFKLRAGKGIILAVTGLQGTGKSASMYALHHELVNDKKVLAFKWPASGNLEDAIRDFKNFSYDRNLLVEELYKIFSKRQDLLRKFSKEHEISLPKNEMKQVLNGASLEEDDLLSHMPAKARKRLWKEGFRKYLQGFDAVMIDMPDYPKNDRRTMVKDLNEVQNVWNILANENRKNGDKEFHLNLVLFIQKEMFYGPNGVSHFLLGKADTIELKPLSPQQLIEAYRLRFETTDPFTENAVFRIAQLSRGVFRRFLRYIQLCLEHVMFDNVSNDQIDTGIVETAVPNDEIAKDMDTELSDLFPRSEEMKKKATRLISLLASQKQGINQKEASIILHLNEMDVSRLCDKLETYGYIKRKRTNECNILKTNF